MKAISNSRKSLFIIRHLFTLVVLLVFSSLTAGAAAVNTACAEADACFRFKYYGPTFNSNNTVTLKFSVQVDCNKDLGYVAFELPAGAKALKPGKHYKKRFNYVVENPVKKPFRGIKFQAANANRYKNGVTDTFQYVLSAAAFATMNTIKVQAKAAGTIGQVTFNAAGCNIACSLTFDNGCQKEDCCFGYDLAINGLLDPSVLFIGFNLSNVCGSEVTGVNISLPAGTNMSTLNPITSGTYESFSINTATPNLLRFIATAGGNAWDGSSPFETEEFVFRLPLAFVNMPGKNLVTVTILTTTNSYSLSFDLTNQNCYAIPLLPGKPSSGGNDPSLQRNSQQLQAGLAEKSMTIYPNPASDAAFHVKLNAAANRATLQIRDLTGRVIHTREMKKGEDIEIDGKALGMTAGIYLISLQTGDSETVEKLIVH